MNALVVFAVAAAVMSGSAVAQTEGMAKDEYKAAAARIDRDYDAAKIKCDDLSGNAKDICRAEAKASERMARAELDARRKPGVRADYMVEEARADGAYEVAREKCDDLAGNTKDVCVKEAKAARTKAIADAKTARAEAQAGKTTDRTQGYIPGPARP